MEAELVGHLVEVTVIDTRTTLLLLELGVHGAVVVQGFLGDALVLFQLTPQNTLHILIGGSLWFEDQLGRGGFGLTLVGHGLLTRDSQLGEVGVLAASLFGVFVFRVD